MNMNSPLISVIIPVYNVSEYLPPLMEQLQNQTLRDFEILFINDCSKDNSAEILTEFAQSDSRVRIFHHDKNRCQGAARNTGLDHARGEFIVYVDADDSIPNNYFESLYSAIIKYNADLAICNSIWVYPHHEVRHNMFMRNPNQPELLLSGEDALEQFYSIFKNDIRIPVEPWGRIIRRGMIEKYQMRNPETLHEDVVMGYSELLFSQKVLLLNQYLYYYNRKNTTSVLIERKKQYIRDFPLIFIGIRDVLLKNGLYERQRDWLTRFYFQYPVGVYTNFSYGEDFSETMKEAILHYRTLLEDPIIEGSEKFIFTQLVNFKFEMERYNLQEVFTLFTDTHPEIWPLLRKNVFFCLINVLYVPLKNKTVWNIFQRIVIDPHYGRRRYFITYFLNIYNKVHNHF